MSSYRKDARWQLAFQMLEGTPGESFDGVPYELSSEILALAEAVLTHFNDPELELRLAKKFGEPPEEVD